MRPISVTFSFLISILFWTPPLSLPQGEGEVTFNCYYLLTIYSPPLGRDRLPLTFIIFFTIYSPPYRASEIFRRSTDVLLCLVRGAISIATRGQVRGWVLFQSTPASTSLTTLSTSLSSFSGSYSFLSEALNVHANT